MGFRFRRSTRLGPLRFNYRFAGLRLQQGWIELDLRWGRGNSLLSSRVARFARLIHPGILFLSSLAIILLSTFSVFKLSFQLAQ